MKEWGFDDNHNFTAALWDCVTCGVESSTPFRDEEEKEIDHSKCDLNPCFGCKAKGLQLNTGDAGRPISDKKWKSNLAEYRKAREQGIQPASTNVHATRAAVEASQKLGTAYDANTMVRADKVTKSNAALMKEVSNVS